jgi:hypothetical protein
MIEPSALRAAKAYSFEEIWGDLDHPWSGLKSHTKAPTDKGYTKIYSNAYTFTRVWICAGFCGRFSKR